MSALPLLRKGFLGLTSAKKDLFIPTIGRRMNLQVFDLKDRSPAWAQALFLKRIHTLRAGATLFPCAWH
jgi:hypothetical protein